MATRLPRLRSFDRASPLRSSARWWAETPTEEAPMAYEAGDYETITLERRGHVGVLTLNRPDRLNAINRAMMDEMARAVAAVRADHETRVLAVPGAGRGFCAGADLMGAGPVATVRTPEPTS